ncbi:alpha-keto acid decarboxylase family protein [Dongshaea marina]|uniref:alpha-keto acid decarboxylase family protein n=1 Tax=Dongshaea marina TaxID=2047966 RepID=UPI000D3E13A6|nr:thiamine pyrophosphate-binding protein [Dongshaea marina]
MSKPTTVIEYVLQRIKSLGVTDIFGVPGDFVYPVCDAIIDDEELQWISCTNELNASYAADGYARTRGVGVLVSTYGAGELCTLGGLAGAHAESSQLISLTGMPGLAEQRKKLRYHHMIGDQDPDYDLFVQMTRPLTAGGDGAVVITPQNCVYETERLIAAMRYYSKPINLAFPRDVPHAPVIMPSEPLPIPLSHPTCDPQRLAWLAQEICYRLHQAKQPCVIPGYLLRRHQLVDQARVLINKTGLPFVDLFQGRGIVGMDHPNYIGSYMGQYHGWADPWVTGWVESSDCILALGTESHDFNNGFHTLAYDPRALIKIMPHSVQIGDHCYENIHMQELLTDLIDKLDLRLNSHPPLPESQTAIGSPLLSDSPLNYEALYQQIQAFIKPGDILISDTAMASMCFSARAELPAGVDLESQLSWGAIGWGTPAALGHAIAAPERRCVILAGEGGHQMTMNELGTFERYGVKPVFLVINNGGYLAERVTNRNPDEIYNDLPPWQFSELPKALGCHWLTRKISRADGVGKRFKRG